MAKVYISQPMRGLDDAEILRIRSKAIESATKHIHNEFGPDEPVEILDTFVKGVPADANPLVYLSNNIKLLAEADLAFFCNGFEKARGCRVERYCAGEYGTPLIVEDYSDNTVIMQVQK